MSPSHSLSPTAQPGQNLSMPALSHEAMAHIAPLLSGLSFLAMHGYQRRGGELSLSCRLASSKSSGITLRVYPEGARTFELGGISFRVEVEGNERSARIATLDDQGIARIEGISRMDRVRLTLDVTK
jgi:hypothetical protein